MSQELVKSAERIKQEIDFQKENLKFLNSFYLPLITSLVILVVGDGSIPWLHKVGWFLIGSLGIGYLTLLKLDVIEIIDELINDL
ncbi:MAG TPA: hypothetical protein VGM30_05135 [Puia sp.]|jgi:hypothetical protein